MERRHARSLIALVTLAVTATSAASFAGELPAGVKDELATAKYVYISSERKGGGFGKPAEIWFFYDQGAVWVGTPPTTWRVKRIKAGRTAAKVAVGKADGPSFDAVGSLVSDPKVAAKMFETYAKKYPDGWPKYEQRFRDGMKDGSRVLVKYVPK